MFRHVRDAADGPDTETILDPQCAVHMHSQDQNLETSILTDFQIEIKDFSGMSCSGLTVVIGQYISVLIMSVCIINTDNVVGPCVDDWSS